MDERRKKLIYDFICDDCYVPMKKKEMAMLLQVPKESRQELEEILNALEKEGKIHMTRKGSYVKGEGRFIQGIFQAHARGYGFVITEQETEDIFIPEEETGGAFQGDEVEVLLTKEPKEEGRRREGKIVRILKRGTVRLVGRYQAGKNYGFVLPDDRKFSQDVFIPEGKSKGAVSGHKVVVELTSYGGKNKKPEGRVTEILGHVHDPGVDILSIVKGFENK